MLAALRRQPVDRIPYCEPLFDVSVTEGILGGLERLTDDPALLAMLRSDDERTKTRAGFLVEPEVSAAIGRDSISYWNSLYPFPGPEMYLLNPGQKHLGYSADGLIKRRTDLDKLVFRDLDDAFWAPARRFVERKGDFAACAVIFLGIDPTWHSMGFEHFSVALIEDPGLVEAVLGRFTDWLSQVMTGLCALDFDFMYVADDIAFKTGPMFSPKIYRRLLLPLVRKVAAQISKPWIYHSDGNLMPILDDLLSLGMQAIHPLEPGSMDPLLLKQRYGDRLAFVGNINVDTLCQGTPEAVRGEVRERIAQLGPGYGYLLSSSNSVMPGCRPENVIAMLQTLREYGRYPLRL